jgi:hypothetical protein
MIFGFHLLALWEKYIVIDMTDQAESTIDQEPQQEPQPIPWREGPLPWQTDALAALSDSKNVLIHGGLGSGKTWFMVRAITEAMFREPQIVVFSESLQTVRTAILESGLSLSRIGRKGISWISSLHNLQGISGPIFLAIDRAHVLSEDAWHVLAAVSCDRSIQLAIAGIPLLESTGFIDILKNPPPNTEVFHATSHLVSPAWLATKRRDWGEDPDRCRAFIEGELPHD